MCKIKLDPLLLVDRNIGQLQKNNRKQLGQMNDNNFKIISE